MNFLLTHPEHLIKAKKAELPDEFYLQSYAENFPAEIINNNDVAFKLNLESKSMPLTGFKSTIDVIFTRGKILSELAADEIKKLENKYDNFGDCTLNSIYGFILLKSIAKGNPVFFSAF